MITSRECKERAAECREMVERAPNVHVRAALNDMARSWERLAIQAAQFSNQAQLDFFFATSSEKLRRQWFSMTCACIREIAGASGASWACCKLAQQVPGRSPCPISDDASSSPC
jgi:hypothetical protein